MTSNNEKRAITFDDGEVRFHETEKRTLEGYASVFNVATDLGSFQEIIEPGAFSRALKENQDVRALIDHDAGRVIGRTKNDTLELREDSRGLFSRISLPDTQDGNDLATLIDRGDLDAMSFGFTVQSERWEERDGQKTRYIEDVDLWDVSVVAYPAYTETSVALRSMPADQEVDDIRRRRFRILLHNLRQNSWKMSQL